MTAGIPGALLIRPTHTHTIRTPTNNSKQLKLVEKINDRLRRSVVGVRKEQESVHDVSSESSFYCTSTKLGFNLVRCWQSRVRQYIPFHRHQSL